MAQPSGYSGRTLIQKIGLKPGQMLVVVHPPAHYAELVAPLPPEATLRAAEPGDDLRGAAVLHLFVRGADDLERDGPRLAADAAPGAALWVSWPKKSSPLFTGVTEDTIRQVMLPTGWVDVKVAAVDEDWSGLKLLRRRVS
jgi:hypothetical protein